MKGKEDAIAGLCFIALAVAFIIPSLSFPGGTSDGVPGPGYFPILLGVLLILLSIGLIVTGIVKQTSFNVVDDLFKANAKPFLLTIVAVIAYLVLWNFLPFLVNTSLFLFALGLIYERKIVYNIIFSVVTTVVLYLVFNNVFHVML
jgi:putative tricarboxylic transport membrane protein